MARFEVPPLSFGGAPTDWIRKVAVCLRGVMRGNTNNVRLLTLEAGATSTTLVDEILTPSSIVVLTPLTANASTVAYYVEAALGEVVVFHASTGTTDRTFGVVIHGG